MIDPTRAEACPAMQSLPPEALTQVASYFQALAEPTRLHLLNLLREQERNVGELAELSGYSAANVSRHLALLSQQAPPSDPADAAQARARILDVLSHAVGALVLSRACPDDSPLADEILAVCRDAILGSQTPPGAEKAKTRKRKAG